MADRIEVSVPVYPSEDLEKVKRALSNVLVNPLPREVERRGVVHLVCEFEGCEVLEVLRQLIDKERIQSAARRHLRQRILGNTLIFFLKKQAAFAGRLSFSEPSGESPLGPIEFKVVSDNINALVDWLAPRARESHRFKKRRESSFKRGWRRR